MSVSQIKRLIGADQNKGSRIEDDFYPTPSYVTEALLRNEDFSGNIWEPACGDGAISNILLIHGYNVISSDLNDYGYGETGKDFFKQQEPYDNIITNPPFNVGTKFAIHALNLAQKKVALFLKLAFLEGIERKEKLWSRRNLETVYVFSKRVGFGKEAKGGMMAFAWFVWNKEFEGASKIKWL